MKAYHFAFFYWNIFFLILKLSQKKNFDAKLSFNPVFYHHIYWFSTIEVVKKLKKLKKLNYEENEKIEKSSGAHILISFKILFFYGKK